MVEHLPTCGNCRSPNVGHVPDGGGAILETDEELDVDDDEEESEGIAARIARVHNRLNEYRRESRHLNTHYERSFLWRTLPYGIDTWSLYNDLLRNFVDLFPNQPMYVHGMVELPMEPTRAIFFYAHFKMAATYRCRLVTSIRTPISTGIY